MILVSSMRLVCTIYSVMLLTKSDLWFMKWATRTLLALHLCANVKAAGFSQRLICVRWSSSQMHLLKFGLSCRLSIELPLTASHLFANWNANVQYNPWYALGRYLFQPTVLGLREVNVSCIHTCQALHPEIPQAIQARLIRALLTCHSSNGGTGE